VTQCFLFLYTVGGALSHLPVARIGESSTLRAGEFVVAVRHSHICHPFWLFCDVCVCVCDVCV
jgi:hypothetical protein